MSDIPIEAPVIIRERLSDRTFRGTLPNGKVVLVFVPSDEPAPDLRGGEQIIGALSLADFSRCKFIRTQQPGLTT